MILGLCCVAVLSVQSFFGVDDTGQIYQYESFVADETVESLSDNSVPLVEEEENVEVSVLYDNVDMSLFYAENQMVLQEILAEVGSISDSLSSNSNPDSEPEVHTLSLDTYSSGSLPDSGVVVVAGSVGGQNATLIMSQSFYESLWVSADNYLFNVSADNVIVGRLFYSDTFNSSDYAYSTYSLSSIYGSSNNVYRYGGYNYITEYYRSGSGIDSDRTYADFLVSDIYLASAPTVEYKTYIAILAVVILLGGVVICSYRSSRRW